LSSENPCRCSLFFSPDGVSLYIHYANKALAAIYDYPTRFTQVPKEFNSPFGNIFNRSRACCVSALIQRGCK
jgi:hypothetical protein